MAHNYDLRTWTEVDLGAVKHNFSVLSSCLPSNMKRLAVVKADAYCHGAPRVAKALSDAADYFAVACASE